MALVGFHARAISVEVEQGLRMVADLLANQGASIQSLRPKLLTTQQDKIGARTAD
jgi:hypothetical protein